jgi:hypothetical protein
MGEVHQGTAILHRWWASWPKWNPAARRGPEVPPARALGRRGHVAGQPPTSASVVMTALASVAGMLPLAFALGAGSQMLQPLAIAVMGGVLISMVLSLIITPAVRSYLSSHQGNGRNAPRSAVTPWMKAEAAPAEDGQFLPHMVGGRRCGVKVHNFAPMAEI